MAAPAPVPTSSITQSSVKMLSGLHLRFEHVLGVELQQDLLGLDVDEVGAPHRVVPRASPPR